MCFYHPVTESIAISNIGKQCGRILDHLLLLRRCILLAMHTPSHFCSEVAVGIRCHEPKSKGLRVSKVSNVSRAIDRVLGFLSMD